jgi:hypothetical protein
MKRHLFFALLVFACAGAFAQTAAELELLLETKTVSLAAASCFVLEAAELLPSGLAGPAAETAAYDMALSKGWVKKNPSEAATLKDTAFLVMKAFSFKGGALYSLFRNPRYAYREMLYKKIIQGRADPGMKVSGQRLLQIIGRALNYSGDSESLDIVNSEAAH